MVVEGQNKQGAEYHETASFHQPQSFSVLDSRTKQSHFALNTYEVKNQNGPRRSTGREFSISQLQVLPLMV